MKTRFAYPVLIGAALTALAFVGCGGSSMNPTMVPMGGGGTPMSTPTPSPSGSGMGVISGFAFNAMTVAVNTTVTWRNDDTVPHTATADASSAFQFNTGNIAPGATSQGVVFSQVGTFTYHCTVHPAMHGTIIVQ
jgi:hypothetical protein